MKVLVLPLCCVIANCFLVACVKCLPHIPTYKLKLLQFIVYVSICIWYAAYQVVTLFCSVILLSVCVRTYLPPHKNLLPVDSGMWWWWHDYSAACQKMVRRGLKCLRDICDDDDDQTGQLSTSVSNVNTASVQEVIVGHWSITL